MAAVFLPGQCIPEHFLAGINTIGCGIENRNGKFTATQPGLLRLLDGKAWLSVQTKRYIPQEGDYVIGVVNSKAGDLFKIDIGSADLASISFLSFEGATKRNRPNVKIGDLLFAKIVQTSKHLEPELTCVDQYNRAKGLGLIASTNGLFTKVSIHLGRRLLSPQCPLLKLLGKDFKFEVTIGMNGRIWINGPEIKDISLIRQTILDSEYIVDHNIPEFVEKTIRKYRGFDDLPMELNK